MTDKTKVPHVYTAMGEVFRKLSVGKDGRLPSNMGGGGYMTAEAVTEATREEFAKVGLILLANEVETSRESIIHKDRLNFASSVTGTYTIVSTEDGSEVTVSGTGHGLATGTAVAANVASTFALKNALLRTFMVVEQSVENDAMADPQGMSKPKATENRSTRNVNAATQKVSPKGETASEKKAKAAVKAEFIDEQIITPEYANKRRDEFKKQGSQTPLADLLAELRSGDLGDA